jgi:hypothetical protein
MPFIENATYRVPRLYANSYVNTIYPALFRSNKGVNFQRQREEMPDGDFVDFDWSYAPKGTVTKLLICVHGLEGHARKPYMANMMRRFNTEGYDAVGINMRGCSGEDNRLLQGYHSGRTDDLAYLVNKMAAAKHYTEIVIIGFSVGGNIVLKYAGEQGQQLPDVVKKIVTFSVPCNLAACSFELEKPKNYIYQWQFLVTLKQKARAKFKRFPNSFNLDKVLTAKYFRQFDDYYTAPINGFENAEDYWAKASSLSFLPFIKVPTLLVNAADDSFLEASCYPLDLAHTSPVFHLEIPRKGGHLGFMAADTEGYFWTEHRAWAFVNSLV